MKCPGFQKLLEFLDGQLTVEEARGVADHLDRGCISCVGDRDWYQTLKAITRSDEIYRPALWVRKRAVELFKDERFSRGGLIEAARSAAQVVYDSLQGLSFAGARPAEATGRQLIYQAAGYNVDIQIAASPQAGADIMGQVLREGEAGFASVNGLLVDLVQKRHDVWSTTTSAFGEFMMHEIESGRYDLRIETNETVITIEGLPVLQ